MKIDGNGRFIKEKFSEFFACKSIHFKEIWKKAFFDELGLEIGQYESK